MDDVLTPPFRAKTAACSSDDSPEASFTISEDALLCALAARGTTRKHRRARITEKPASRVFTAKSFTVSSAYERSAYERSAYEWNERDAEHVRIATHDFG